MERSSQPTRISTLYREVHTLLFTALDPFVHPRLYQPGCADRRPGHRVIEMKLRAAKSNCEVVGHRSLEDRSAQQAPAS